MGIPAYTLERFSMEKNHVKNLRLDFHREVVPGSRHIVGGLSGLTYNFDVDLKSVLIRPTVGSFTKLWGKINDREEISFHLYTRLGHETPTHDLHAGIFYDAFLAYLIANGNIYNVIRDQWGAGTTNFRQYTELMNEKLSVEQRAFKTWSGKKALLNGFNKVEAVSKTGLGVSQYEFLFYR